jgi:hypothetical protein
VLPPGWTQFTVETSGEDPFRLPVLVAYEFDSGTTV